MIDSVAAPATDPAQVLPIYRRHPAIHPYGIYDVVNLWASSTWWVDGDAVVGVLDLPGSPAPVVYAVGASPRVDDATLRLLARLAPALPPQLVITGPLGLTARLAHRYRTTWSAPHRKMHLARPSALPSASDAVSVLDRDDLSDLERLFALDPHAGSFFHPGLLDTGCYVGIRAPSGDPGGDVRPLIAVAGIHVVDRRQAVAAIGNVSTHPSWRRRGLARAVVSALCRRLLVDVEVVGLNVRRDNVAARALYHGLGFDELIDYEEAELTRRR